VKHKKFEWVEKENYENGVWSIGWSPSVETFIEHWQSSDTCEEVAERLSKSLEEAGYSDPHKLLGSPTTLGSRAGHWRNRGVPLKSMPVWRGQETDQQKIARLSDLAVATIYEKNETIL